MSSFVGKKLLEQLALELGFAVRELKQLEPTVSHFQNSRICWRVREGRCKSQLPPIAMHGPQSKKSYQQKTPKSQIEL
jgi:hypothetical protein